MRRGEHSSASAVVFGGDSEFEHTGNYKGRADKLGIGK
jgi:hypothetical protein